MSISDKLDQLERKYLTREMIVFSTIIYECTKDNTVLLRDLKKKLQQSDQNLSNILKRLATDDLIIRSSTFPKFVHPTEFGKQFLKRLVARLQSSVFPVAGIMEYRRNAPTKKGVIK
jgi:Mn-dependent DtxR family transcriptional regulator